MGAASHGPNSQAGPGRPAEPDFFPEVAGSRVVYEGRVVTLRVDEITTPGGQIVTREVVEHPGAVVIIALDDDGLLYLVRQYRHALGRYLLELPAGGLEPGEEPLAGARRELREEVGLAADRWTALGSFFSSPGFANELLHVFLAEALVSGESDPDDDEDLSVVRYPLTAVPGLAQDLCDAKSLAALYLLEAHRKQA
jgi:ADP-ribose pyrophosphatase